MRLALLLVALLCASIASSQEIAQVVEGASRSLPGIETLAVFPKNPERTFPVNERSGIFIAFVNGVNRHINITHVEGHITDHFGQLIQNLTTNPYGINTPPGVSVSLDYAFKLDSILEAQDYNLVLEVFFRDGATNLSDVAFNGTISVTIEEEVALVQDLFLLVGVTAFFGGLGYLAYGAFVGSDSRSSSSYSSRASSSSSSSSERGTGADSSWLADTAAVRKSPKRASGKKKKGKKK